MNETKTERENIMVGQELEQPQRESRSSQIENALISLEEVRMAITSLKSELLEGDVPRVETTEKPLNPNRPMKLLLEEIPIDIQKLVDEIRSEVVSIRDMVL